MPQSIELDGVKYRRVRTVKHDFFAATGFYDDPDGRRVVLKISRTHDFAGVPLEWMGKWLCRREQRFYARLADLSNVPKVLGVFGAAGFILQYVAGQPLSQAGWVPDGFFHDLQRLMNELHRRGLAYVDANKMQNILVGADGQPHLIDFQISWDLAELGPSWINRLFLQHLQGSDRYHLLKHKNRRRPDEMTSAELARVGQKSLLLRLHRFALKPYFKFRRRTFHRLRETGRLLPEGSK